MKKTYALSLTFNLFLKVTNIIFPTWEDYVCYFPTEKYNTSLHQYLNWETYRMLILSKINCKILFYSEDSAALSPLPKIYKIVWKMFV